jgi:hypothetical protein
MTSPTIPSLVGIQDAGVETVVSTSNPFVRLWVVEAIARDAEATDGDRKSVGEDEPVARPIVPVVLNPRRPGAELALQPLEHLPGFDDVGVTGEVTHQHLFCTLLGRLWKRKVREYRKNRLG